MLLITYYPDHMQDPSSVVDKAQAASLRTAGACQNTVVPSDNLRVDSRDVPVVFHKRHTWAAPGNWPWGSAGLWDKKMFSCEDRIIVLLLSAHQTGLTIKRCPPPLLSPLVEVTAGAHEAAHHGRNDGHKQEDGGGDASYGGWTGGVGRRCTFHSRKPLLHKLIISNVPVGYATLSRKLYRRDTDIDDIETSKRVKSRNCVTGELARSVEKVSEFKLSGSWLNLEC